MHFNNPILFFICSIGVFNGFLASFYFIFFSKQKRIQNLFLGLLLLFLSIRIGKSVYTIFTAREERHLLILQIGLSACFLIGVALFYYLKSAVENTKKIPNSWKIHMSLLSVFIVSIGLIKPYATNGSFWNPSFVYLIYTVWGIYLLLSSFVLKNIFRKFFSKKNVCTTSEVWLVVVFASNVLIYLAYIIGYFYLYIVGTITFSVVFYGLLIFLLFKKNRENVFQDVPEKYASKKIEIHEATQITEALHQVILQKKSYKNPNLKLNDIAKEIQVSSHKLSQFLNDNLGKSFAQFINEFKVEEAKRMLKEKHQYTLEAIGFDSGFSSKSTFYAAFKKIEGKTPAEYKKQLS